MKTEGESSAPPADPAPAALPVEPLPPGQPFPLGTAVEVRQRATEYVDAKFEWEQGSLKPFPGVRLDGVLVKGMERQLRWYPAVISGAYDPASGRYAEVAFEDGDEQGRHQILARFVRSSGL